MFAIIVGQSKSIWAAIFRHYRVTPIWNISWWMGVLFGFTRMAHPKNTQGSETVGKSRGGVSTKVHASVDVFGNPLQLLLTERRAPEYGQAAALIEGFQADYVLADKGYDSDEFVGVIVESGAIPVVPSRKNRKQPREYD